MFVSMIFLIELKYIKREDYSEVELERKKKEAVNQIDKYIEDKRINTDKLKEYIVVFVKDECKLLEQV